MSERLFRSLWAVGLTFGIVSLSHFCFKQSVNYIDIMILIFLIDARWNTRPEAKGE